MKTTYLFLSLFLFVAFSACTQPIEPESGLITYAVLHTPTNYMGADSIHFETISTIGGNPLEFQLPLQTQPGWQNSLEYHKPHCPDWSQDGRHAVFNDGRNIAIYDWSENRPELIELDYALVWDVVLSPDHTKVAFAGNPDIGNLTIWLVDLASKKVERLVNCEICQSPAWRPDGKAIAYVNSSSFKDSIEVLDLNSKEIVESHIINIGQIIFPTEGPILSWSPDGKLIAFSSEYGNKRSISVLSLETGDIEPMITNVKVADSPVWSPIGSQLLYRESEVLKSPLPGEIPDRAITNLVITSADGKGRYVITEFDNPDHIITCPRWLMHN